MVNPTRNNCFDAISCHLRRPCKTSNAHKIAQNVRLANSHRGSGGFGPDPDAFGAPETGDKDLTSSSFILSCAWARPKGGIGAIRGNEVGNGIGKQYFQAVHGLACEEFRPLIDRVEN